MLTRLDKPSVSILLTVKAVTADSTSAPNVADGHLWCNAKVIRRDPPGTTIGMSTIKQDRLSRSLTSHPGLPVGQCVPFYFCPRSVMLYVIFKANHPDLDYRGGQEPIVHLEADLHQVRKEVQPGRMFVYETGRLTNPRYIINFPTKRHWRGKSRLEDIESGLEDLAQKIREWNIRSIAIPPLGSSLGGLAWAEVAPRIEAALRGLDDVKIVVFTPDSGPTDAQSNRSTDVPKMTPTRAALVSLMRRYLGGLLEPFVTLLEVHKLMYFLEQAGQPLKLNFQKGPFGPYAETLRHVLNEIEGHFVSGYADGGDAPDKELELVAGATEDAAAYLQGQPEMRKRVQRVTELVEGFETSFGMELLATVHWVAAKRPSATLKEVIADVYEWNSRKKQFSERQIGLAYGVLKEKGWLAPATPAGET